VKRKLEDGRPIFLQIKENIEEDILNGTLGAGDQIPSTNELVNLYTINPVTVLKGVSMLTDEGIIYKKRGIGMFVAQDAFEKLQGRYTRSFAEDYGEKIVYRARQLGMTKKALQDLINRIWAESEAGRK
jgi:DNA-binding transcriptional regulator YhcF (GntR family)